MEIGLKVLEGDKAFYYLHRDDNLIGSVITHVDDFKLAGTDAFNKEVLQTISRELAISQIERIISTTLKWTFLL